MITEIEKEFLLESNLIEDEKSNEAYEDAVTAWEYFRDNDNPFSLESILHCHYLLMQRVYPNIAGKIRECDVWIGGSCKPFISIQLIKDSIKFLCKKIINSTDVSEEITKKYHVEFEFIHPFVDGNGRVGRILYNAHRMRLGLTIHVIHSGDEQYEYYKWFNKGDK